MLANTLVTNEVKDSAGAEVEMTRIDIGARRTVFAKIGESPAAPTRLSISHSEMGSGVNKRRRSAVRIDLTSAGQVDSAISRTSSVYIVLDSPMGNSTDSTQQANAIAMLLSFCASLGANTTILYDCTGNGAAALLAGSI